MYKASAMGDAIRLGYSKVDSTETSTSMDGTEIGAGVDDAETGTSMDNVGTIDDNRSKEG